jgi:hypothetical protein
VDPAGLAHDLDEPLGRCAFRQVAAPEATAAYRVPGRGLQLEKPLAVDQRPASEPGERRPLEDLNVRRRRVVLFVLPAIAGDPFANVLLGTDPRGSFAVDEEVVLQG